MALKVVEVQDKGDLKRFLDLPFSLYKNDPLWIPPLRSYVASLLTAKHPFSNHAQIRSFLALKDGKTVGRVAAIVDMNFIAYHQSPTGYFGFFESVNDLDVAQALFEVVEGELKRAGMTKVIGPMNPSTNYECGMLIEGFSTPPFIMMPHNPPYYPRLLESIGFQKAKDLYANLIIGDGRTPERLQRLAQRVKTRLHGIRIRELRAKHLRDEIKLFVQIYHEAWAKNWGFVPMSEEEVAFLARSMKDLIIPQLALFSETQKGEPIGFILAIPNYNPVLKAMGGRLTPWGILKALWVKRKITELRVPLFGIRPPYRLRGIDVLLYTEVFRRGWQRGYRSAELSWILEDNHLMQKAIEAMGGRPYKRYRIYQKDLT